jgi:hypothetical protein
MKMLRFLFAAVGFGALCLGLSLAAEASDPPRQPASSETRVKGAVDRPADPGQKDQPLAGREQAVGKQSGHKPEERPVPESATKTDKRHPGRKPPLPLQGKDENAAGEPTRNAQTTTASANAAGPHRPVLNTSAGTVKAGTTINKTQDHLGWPLARLSSPAPPSQVVAHRGPGTAIIGGPAGSSARNTAVISGTSVKHRP